jgi:multidrug resistance efflux pump
MHLIYKGSIVRHLLLFLLIISLSLYAKEYYAKVEPYEVKTIAANVSGLVTFADEKREGGILDAKPYILIDDELDQIELEKNIAKIALLENTLTHNREMEKNYKLMLEKKQLNYDRVKALKIKSTVEKDKEFYDLVTTQNQYLGTLKEIENLQVQINDLKLRQAQLRRSIQDKRLSARGYVLYSLKVKEGQVVNLSTPLAEVADVSKAKLTVYLNAEDMKKATEQVIYLDGKKSEYRVSRLWNIADDTHLSSYKAEIVIEAPKNFSRLVKIEFKDQ